MLGDASANISSGPDSFMMNHSDRKHGPGAATGMIDEESGGFNN